jgi:hypothetical protein
MHDFLSTNDFKDFTLETAARNPPAGAGARQSMFANGKVNITPSSSSSSSSSSVA